MMLRSCCFLMDKHLLLPYFRYIILLSSLTYTFTALHTIQYAMQDHNDYNTTTTAQDYDPDHSQAASTSTHNATQPATTSTSESMKKSSGQWTDNEVKLLNYVESNCTLTTARGLTLKKSEFNKACATVKLKDANQCHYKWGQVCIFIISDGFHYLSALLWFITYVQYTKQFHSGTKSKKSGSDWHDNYGANT